MSAPFPHNPLPGDDEYDEEESYDPWDEYYDDYDPYADEFDVD